MTHSAPVPAPSAAPAPAPAVSKPAVIFDLDGTLVDPAGAITGGIAEALRAHEIPVPSQEVLNSLVGPPLATGLKALPGVRDEDVPSVVAHYRRGYLEHGMAASEVYPGIRNLLERLRAAGAGLAVATSKPGPMAERLLSIQGILDFFDAVHGSDPDETVPHAGKAPIIAAALDSLGLSGLPAQSRRQSAVMVGDRIFDVEGAHANGLACIGVRWGYAPAGELDTAGAEQTVDDTDSLATALGSQLSLPAAQL